MAAPRLDLTARLGRMPSSDPKRPSSLSARSERRENPLETLQRRFVDGSMTVEEYERELDRLYSERPLTRV